MAGRTNCDNTIASGKQDIVGWAWAHHALSTGCTPRFKKRFAPTKASLEVRCVGPLHHSLYEFTHALRLF